MREKLKIFLHWAGRHTRTDMDYVARGSFWMMTGNVTLVLVSLAVSVAFANLIPVETFGTYQFIVSVLGIISILALPGMGPALARSVAKKKEGTLSDAFKTVFGWASIGSVGLLATAGWYFLHNNPALAGAFFITALFFPLESASSIFPSFWQGKKRFDLQALYRALHALPAAAVLILTLFLTDNIILIILALFSSRALFGWFIYLRAKSKTENNKTDKELAPFGKHLTLMGAVETAATHIDKIILWKFLGPIQVATYSLSIMPIQKLSILNPIYNIALPKLSEHGVKGNTRKRDIFRKFLIAFGITIPVALFLVFIAPFVYGLLFPQYLDSIPYFRALCALVALTPFTLLSASLVAEMKTKFLYGEQITVPIIKIALFAALTPFYGIWGIVLAIVAAEILRGGLLTYFFWKM